MNRRRSARVVALLAVVAAVCLTTAAPAAASTAGDRSTVLAGWTQPPVTSYNAWIAARNDEAAWAAYRFDWSTDYCSASPDQPLGFDFRMPCARHDFGYRNYRLSGTLPANKARVDSALYADLERACGRYSAWVRPSCDSLAWTYYHAAHIFGSVVVTPADLTRAQLLKQQGEARAKAA